MNETIKVNDNFTIVIEGELMTFKKNGLSIGLSMDELDASAKAMRKLADKMKAKFIDGLNKHSDREI